ncbi:MAG: ABC transporter ATP-binding protein, partial [Candidatus Methanomethylophilaceae archaeon]|nr:ABC transporter ATP-binding protein [Candidatus Methanomethylophilaceae archaeon]
VVLWYVASNESKRRMSLISLSMTSHMRESLNRKLMRVPVSYIDNTLAGDMSSRFTNDIPAVSKLVSSDYTGFIAHLTMIVSILLMMLISSPVLGLIFLLMVPVVIFIGWRISTRSERDFSEMSVKVAELNSQMNDIITTHKTMKVEGLESEVVDQFKRTNRDFTSAYVKSHTRSGMLNPMVSTMMNVGYLLTVIIGAVMLYYHNMPVGMFLTFMIYVRVMSTPLLLTVTLFDSIREETVSLNRIMDVLNAPEEEGEDTDGDFRITDGVIKVEDVSFSYNGERKVLKGVSVEFVPGKVYAVTGSTGSGKTTLANLLMGFYRPDSGSITIDGRDIKKISREELGTNLTAVLQNPWMFSGTIRENIIYNRPDLGEEDLKEVASLTGLDSYVNELPDGYDTAIGEESTYIPLPQRRLLALSRALIGDPKILILDEAVAGLDPIRGQGILDRLLASKSGRTIIIISHNQALIEQVDEVVHLEEGTINSHLLDVNAS